MIPPHAELRFRTRFYLPVPRVGEAGDLEGRACEIVRLWALSRFPGEGDALAAGDFLAGRTNLISIRRQGFVRTTRLASGNGHAGDVWALQAQLADSDVRNRRWAHEVAVGPAGPEGLRVSVRVHDWLEVGELGWQAPRPAAGPPAWALSIAALADGPVTDGHAPLPLDAQPVLPGDGPAFVRRLADPDRRVAVVYLSVPGPRGVPLVDPGAVVRALALQAAVHVASSPDVDEELDEFLGPAVRCYGGALRIYRPGLKPAARDRTEGERHRYIPHGRLAGRPLAELLDEIAREVVRCVPREDPESEPVTFAEIESLRGRRELAVLREETTELRRRSRGGLSAEDARRLFEVNARLEARIAALEKDNTDLARRAFHATERLDEERGRDPGMGGREAPEGAVDLAGLTAALRELPSTPAEALDIAARLYPHRLTVTGRAREAGADASCDDTAVAWRLLVAMAEHLHPLHFDDGAESRSPLEIRGAFGDGTRFDVAFTESKATKASARLRALRTLRYDGADVELLWHVKWGSRPPKLLRAYYHPDPVRRQLVIGWFGDHLETAGTRRM